MQEALIEKVKLRLEAREIPTPAHLSDDARAYLAASIMAPNKGMPAVDDVAGWAQSAANFNARLTPLMEPVFNALPVTTVTRRMGACDVYVATPPGMGAAAQSVAYLDVHGGGFVFGAGRFTLMLTALRAAMLGCTVFGVDYRVPPAHPYPAPLDDCVFAYRTLLAEYGAANVAVGGQSAGGNLAAAMLLRARDEGLALPAACVLLTPELDLTESGDTFYTLRDIDTALKAPLMTANLCYAGGADLTHPYLSPLFGDFSKGFPRTFLQSGTRDLFLSNTVRMHRALLEAGQQAELHVWEAMPHAGYSGATPEDMEVNMAMRDFLVRATGWAL
jgi:acetyl esterase/lipase